MRKTVEEVVLETFSDLAVEQRIELWNDHLRTLFKIYPQGEIPLPYGDKDGNLTIGR